MNNLFTKNIKTNEYLYANDFAIKEIDDVLKDEVKNLEDETKAYAKKLARPFLACTIGLIFLGLFIEFIVEYFTTEELDLKKPFLIISIVLAILFLIVGSTGAISLIKSFSRKKVDELDQKQKELKEKCNKYLNINGNSLTIDVLSPFAKVNNEVITRNSRIRPLDNEEMEVFIDKNDLCFSNGKKIFAISLFSIQSITMNKCARVVNCWNKEETDIKKLREMNVKCYENTYTINESYAIKIKTIHGEFEIIIPSYDIEKVKEIIYKK